MVSELNHDTIKTAIVNLIIADTTIYDESGGTNRLRSAKVGWPLSGEELQDNNSEYVFVTNDFTLESNRVEGIAVTEIGGNESHRVLEHTCRYLVQFVMQGETGRAVEKKLDDMQQKIMKLFDENQDLSGSVDESYPERVIVLKPEVTQGKTRQGRVITLKAVVTTGE